MNSIPAALHSIVDENRRAIRLVLQNETLEEALRCWNRILMNVMGLVAEQRRRVAGGEVEDNECRLRLEVIPSSTRRCKDTSFNDAAAHDRALIFARLLEFVLTEVELQEDDNGGMSNLLSQLSTAIIFNAALVHHLCASKEARGGRNQRKTLRSSSNTLLFTKAKDLYQLAYQSHRDAWIASNHHHLPPLYVLACCNNLGRCYVELMQHGRAKHCFTMLLKTMVLLKPQSLPSCFLRNVLPLLLKDKGLAPAA